VVFYAKNAFVLLTGFSGKIINQLENRKFTQTKPPEKLYSLMWNAFFFF
jgi:hypothetical protein